MTLGAGLVLAGCGDDATTTPAPAPPPPPPPVEPDPPPEPPPDPPPEPEEPEPTPFMVMFSVGEDADEPYPMIPDMDDDEATAMASVNPQMTVTTNMHGIVQPLFVQGAAPIGLVADVPNMPFAYVDWKTMQSMVVSATGAQFSVIPVEIGANQVPVPIGDGVIVSCGPFACAEGPMAPDLSIANSPMCTDWDPTVEIQVGKVDNDVIAPETTGTLTEDEAYATGANTNDGIDLGIVTTSTLEMNVKHVFSGVANGTNTTKTVKAEKGSNKTLAMAAVASIAVDAEADVAGDGTDNPFGVNESAVCEDTANGMGRYDSGDLTDKPAGCFRLMGPGAGGADISKSANYLSGWSIELSPVGADVSWGRVDWEDNPFEDLTCEGMDPIVVADHVDICEMFDAEVDLATGKGWTPTVVFESETADNTAGDTTDNTVVMWMATTAKGSGTSMFKTVWFDDNLNGKIAEDGTSASNRRPMQGDGTVTADDMHDLYNQNSRDGNIKAIWQFLTDADGDLTSGDLGKVDLVSSKDDRSTVDDERTILVESCGGSSKYDPDETSNTWDALPCKTTADDGTVTGSARTTTANGPTATHPDGRADNYESTTFTLEAGGSFTEPADRAANTTRDFTVLGNRDDVIKCDEGDGGDDDDNSLCDADWMNDVEVLFADGTFGCSTTRMVSVTCMWDADGGMAQGRNALPSAFTAGDKKFFLKCEAE